MQQQLSLLQAQVGTLAVANPTVLPGTEASTTTGSAGSPPQVTGLTLSTQAGAVGVTWDSVTIRNLAFYRIQYSVHPDMSSATTVDQGETTFTVPGATNSNSGTSPTGGVTNYVQVAAMDQNGNLGAYSAILNTTTGLAGSDAINPNAATDVTSIHQTSGLPNIMGNAATATFNNA